MKTRMLALILAICALTLLAATPAQAASATWLSSPGSGSWNTDANWNPNTGYPGGNGLSDVATFDLSNTTSVSLLSNNADVGQIIFNSGASAFTITVNPSFLLYISGTGITNNSGKRQNFVTASSGSSLAEIIFTNNATAGSNTSFTNNADFGRTLFRLNATAGSATFTNMGGAGAGYGLTAFSDTSTAGSGTFTNNGTTLANAGGGYTIFYNSSNAGGGTFINNGGLVSGIGASPSGTAFYDTSTAGSGTFTSKAGTASGAPGGRTQFANTSTAGSAKLIANGGIGLGGSILFFHSSSGGTARVEVFNNGTGTPGNLDLSPGGNGSSVTIGSLEGTGNAFLGGSNLTVGSNNLSKSFSGVIQDGGDYGGTGGSLSKIGKGKLTLSNANTYTGGTIISQGSLVAKNTTGSATGTGAVQVNTGTLGSTGIISGAVTVGNGTTTGAVLLPGTANKPGTLTINNTLTFNARSTYKCDLDRPSAKTSTVAALGVTINSNVAFKFLDMTSGSLTPGTMLTVINNTSANPIAGTFSNLADGATLSSGGNTFKANYKGGTGNDLTLTVQ